MTRVNSIAARPGSAHRPAMIRALTAVALSLAALCPLTAQLTEDLPTLPPWPGDVSKIEGDERAFVTADGAAVIVVLEGERGLETVRVPFRNQIAPWLSLSIGRAANGYFRYEYEVGNGPAAIDVIGQWSLVAPPKSVIRTEHHVPPIKRWGSTAFNALLDDTLIPETGPGRYVFWMATHREIGERPVIRPGESSAGFEAVSDLSPGFTIAYFAYWDYPPNADETWPAEVQRQVDPYWSSSLKRRPRRVTLGPTFRDDARPAIVAKNFLVGLGYAVRQGDLSAESEFLKSITAALERARASDRDLRGWTWEAAPSSDLERQIARALVLSLGADEPPTAP